MPATTTFTATKMPTLSKRSIYTNITPLPPSISRHTALQVLHNHAEMIGLNPLVIRHTSTTPHPQAPKDELESTWYELTDKIDYLSGGFVTSHVSYKACFHDLPRGLQTHVYAPAGLEIKGKWSVGGNEPGEPREPLEIGLGAPREGLYLREDVDMRCNVLLTGFVKKNLKRSHGTLVERLVLKAELGENDKKLELDRIASRTTAGVISQPGSPGGSVAPAYSPGVSPGFAPPGARYQVTNPSESRASGSPAANEAVELPTERPTYELA